MMYMECQIPDNVGINEIDNLSINNNNNNNNNSIISMDSDIPENNNNNNVEMELIVNNENSTTTNTSTTITTTTSPVNNNNEDGTICSENSDTIFNELDPNKYFNENTHNEEQQNTTSTTTTTITSNSLCGNLESNEADIPNGCGDDDIILENSTNENGIKNENSNLIASSSDEVYVKGDGKYVYLLDGKKLENLRIKELQDELKKRNVTPKSRFVKSQLIEKLIHLLKREKQGKSNFSIVLASDWALSINSFSSNNNGSGVTTSGEKNEVGSSSSTITTFQNQMLSQDSIITSVSTLAPSQNNTYNALVSGKPSKGDKKKKKKSKDKKQKTETSSTNVKGEPVTNTDHSNKHSFVTQILVQTPQQQQTQITPNQQNQQNTMNFHHSHSSFIQQPQQPPLYQNQMYQNVGYFNNGNVQNNLFHSDSCVPLLNQQNNLLLQQQQQQQQQIQLQQQPIQQYQVPSQIQYQNPDIPFNNYLNDFSQNPQALQSQHLLSQSQPQLQTHQTHQQQQQHAQLQQQQQYCGNINNGVQQSFSTSQPEYTNNSFDFFNQNGIQAITSHQSTPQPYFQSPIIQPTQIAQSQPSQQTNIQPVVQIPNQPPNSPNSSQPLQQVVPSLSFPSNVAMYQPPPLPIDEKESYIQTLKSKITELESQIESLKSNQAITTNSTDDNENELNITSDTNISNEFKLTSPFENEIADKIQIDFKSNLLRISQRLSNKSKKDFVNFMVSKIIQQQPSNIHDYSVFKLTAPQSVQDYIDEICSFSPSIFKELCDSIKIQIDQKKDDKTNIENEKINDINSIGTKVEGNNADIDINLEPTTTTKDEFSVTYEYQKKYHYDDDITLNDNNNNNNELKRIKYF